jgi:hypothetical protein
LGITNIICQLKKGVCIKVVGNPAILSQLCHSD